MNHPAFPVRRTPRLPAFGAVVLAAVLWLTSLAAAAPARLKTVQVGPPYAVRTLGGGVKLYPGLAVAQRVLVRLTPTVDAQQVQRVLGRVQGRFGRHLGRGTYIVDVPAGMDVVSAAAALRLQPGVMAAGPDLLTYPALVPNDPKYSEQYHLPIVQAEAAWNVSVGSASVVIAVVDSGVDLDHPDLAAKIWTNPDEIPGNHADDDGNGYVDDVHGWDFYDNNNDANPSPNGNDDDGNGTADEEVNHGTLVAGIAAGVGNDAWGTAGVDWRAKVMPLQVFPDDGGTAVSTVIEGIYYATDNGADIINLSIGGGYTDMFTDSITDAYNHGVLVVSAGGNSYAELTDASSTWESPVCNDGNDVHTENHVLGVGATDRYDRKASYSNYDGSTASFIEIMAPGEVIYGPTVYAPTVPGFSTYFGTNSGTSFSCPIVTGLAALLLSKTPSATPTQLIATIKNSGDDIYALNPGYTGKFGGGRLNCARALGVPLPPAAPTNLAAADTSNDDGGSVTLTWTKSSDDGTGSDSVTEYGVWRRLGTTGDFVRIETLPPGSETCVDTSTTDGQEYYYKVSASDGTLTSETAVVGPVKSRNDSPPAILAGLVASDRPNDSGGAINLKWTAYTAPSDFALLAIYRSTHSFTSVVGMTPLVTLSDSTRVSWTDTTVSDGVNYYYAIGVRDSAGNEVRSLASVGPVQSFANTGIAFAPGLYFMSAPAIPTDSDPATLFGLDPGSFSYARWSPADNLYLYDGGARPLPSGLQLTIGGGFWVKLNQQVIVSPVGNSAPAGDYNVSLTPGWHQIGNPFFSAINFAEASITYNSATMDLASADSAGIIAAYAWTYDTTTQNYTLVYPPLSATQLVGPWKGIWVLAYKACTLTIARPLGTTAVATATATRPRQAKAAAADLQVDWTLGVRVRAGTARDSEGLVGAASRPVLAPKPPPAQDAPQLKLAAAGEQGTGNYAVSLAQSGQTNIIWNMTVENLRAGQTVEITTPDLSALPTSAVAVLEDRASGQSVYLRTVSRYTFTPRSGETQRSFRLTVSPRSAALLSVQSLSAQGVRGGGAAITFTLSRPAATTISVLNMAGRPIRVMEEGKARTAGNNTVLWDGRSTLGTTVPAGTYLLQVTATGTSGENVRAVSTLRLQR